MENKALSFQLRKRSIDYLLIQLVTAKLSKLEPISNSQKAKQYLESKDLFVYKAKQTLYEAAIFYFLF
jgi:hypothetical protein